MRGAELGNKALSNVPQRQRAIASLSFLVSRDSGSASETSCVPLPPASWVVSVGRQVVLTDASDLVPSLAPKHIIREMWWELIHVTM